MKLGSREMGSKAPRVTRLEFVSEKWKGMKTCPGATMPVIRSSTSAYLASPGDDGDAIMSSRRKVSASTGFISSHALGTML